MLTGNQPAPTRGTWRVFISHSGDELAARAIAEQIRTRGADTFIAVDDINIGETFLLRIVEELRRADELLVLLTPRSIQSTFVSMEVGGALTRGIPIIVTVQVWGDLWALRPVEATAPDRKQSV